jgi:ATP-binding cassette subfamily B protein
MIGDSRLLPPGDLRKAGAAGILTVFGVICGMVPFLFVIDMIEALGNGVPVSRLKGHLGGIGIFILLKVLFNSAGLVLSHRIAYSSLADIRQRIITHLKTLSIGDLKGIKKGELVQVLNHEVEQVELFLAHALPELMVALSVPLVCLGVLFTLKLELVLILVAVIPALLLYLAWFHRAFYSDFGVYAEKSARMGSDLLEYINGIRVIKAFN